MRKKQIFILLLLLAFSLLLRLPQINFPSIGYHNMKENEYISMAKNMVESGDLLSRDVYFYNAFREETQETFNLYPQVPFVAYQILLGYKLFGYNLWFGRLANIFLMLLAILALYFLSLCFFGDYRYALFTVFLSSIMPIGVYFSRNLQPETGAFSFMMMGTLFFVYFIKNFKSRDLFLSAVFFTICGAYKLSFLIGFVPLVLSFPFKRYAVESDSRKILRQVILFSLPFILLVIFWHLTGQLQFPSVKGRVDLFEFFSVDYWDQYGRIIWHYIVNENYGLPYFLVFLGGIIVSWLNFKKDKSLLAIYLRTWSIALIIYCMVFSDFLNQHNYYQFPFLGFLCLSIVYFTREAAKRIDKVFRLNVSLVSFCLVFVFLLVFSFSQIKRAIMSHFNLVFTGTDEVGKFLNDITVEDDRFFIYTFAQGYAPCVYAERKCGWPGSLDEFKEHEARFRIKYVVIYPFQYLQSINQDIRNYLQAEYEVKLIGFEQKNKHILPNILMLEKGGEIDIGKFIKNNHANIELSREYRTVSKRYPFYIMKKD